LYGKKMVYSWWIYRVDVANELGMVDETYCLGIICIRSGSDRKKMPNLALEVQPLLQGIQDFPSLCQDLDLLYTAGSCHGSLSISTPRTVTVHFVPRLSRPPDTVVLQSFPRGAAKVGSWGNPRNGGFIAGKIIELNAGCSELGTTSHNYGNSPPSIWK
jgi:hypothetical protein